MRVLIVGDIYHGDVFADLATLVAERGRDFPFEALTPLLASADHVVGNLEAAVTERTDSPFLGMKGHI